ncbi:MAG: hypothetical protein PHS17_14975, partial [Desulfobacterales bacterium]|nr:hypothetical protein [Desulfobacterales bacterium]
MNTKLSWSSLVLAVIVTFTWMSLFASPGASQPEKEKITIGIEPSENSLLLAIAKEKGFLAKYN